MNIDFSDLIANYYICKQEQNRIDNIRSNIINEFSNRLSQYIINNKLDYKITDYCIYGNNISLLEIDINEEITNYMNILCMVNVHLNLGADICFSYNKNKLYTTVHNSKLDLLYKKD